MHYAITMFLVEFLAAAALAQSAPTSQAPLPLLRRTSPTLDPAKADLARSVASRLLPPGTTRQLLNDPFNPTILSLVHGYLMLPVQVFAASIGAPLPQEGITGPPLVRVGILEIIDPASAERGRIADKAIRSMAAEAAMEEEPRLREALALAYSRLTLEDLKALDDFLGTPAGVAFARTNASLDNDLNIAAAHAMIDRAIAAAAPSMLARLSEETESLPHVKTAAELTPSERRQIADLLHIDVSQLAAKKR